MKRILAAVLLGFGLTAGAVLASVDSEILSRIQPVGNICVQGKECGSAAAPVVTASVAPRSGSEVYGAICLACHNTGAAGAPVIGDASSWAPRVEQGMDTLITHAINGYNAMPAKGGCASCPDEEIAAAVEYLVAESK
jgi:cytochrome c5